MLNLHYLKHIPRRWVIYSLIFLACLASILMIFPALSPALGNDNLDRETCSYKGKKLYGKILVVDSFPDLKIKETSAFPDLNVQLVNSFPNNCGQWQLVESFPDLKVKYVSSFPDITIKFVTSVPGLR